MGVSVFSLSMFICGYFCFLNVFFDVRRVKVYVIYFQGCPWYFKLEFYLVRFMRRPYKCMIVFVAVSGRRKRVTSNCLFRYKYFFRPPSVFRLTWPINNMRWQRLERTRLYFRFFKGLIPCTNVSTILSGAFRVIKLQFTQGRRDNNYARQSSVCCRTNTIAMGSVNGLRPLYCVFTIWPSRLCNVSATRTDITWV